MTSSFDPLALDTHATVWRFGDDPKLLLLIAAVARTPVSIPVSGLVRINNKFLNLMRSAGRRREMWFLSRRPKVHNTTPRRSAGRDTKA